MQAARIAITWSDGVPVPVLRCVQVQPVLEAGPAKNLDGFLDRWGGSSSAA
jgi:hypothetical protein